MFEKLGIYVVLSLLVAGAFGALYTKIQIQKNEILTISIERDNAKAAVKVKQLEVDNSKEAQKTLENLIVKEKENSMKLEEELGVLRNEPESDNDSVGGILKRSIGGLSDDSH